MHKTKDFTILSNGFIGSTNISCQAITLLADVVMETYTAENATFYKVRKDNHFTIISNKLLRSKKLNPKQKGLLLKVLSLPNTWRFSVSGIVRICKEGKAAIKARLAELTEPGYLVRNQLKSNESKNHGFEYIYEFFEIALSKEDVVKKSEKTRKNAKKAVKDLSKEKSKNSTSKKIQKQDSGSRSAENLQTETPQTEKQVQINTAV